MQSINAPIQPLEVYQAIQESKAGKAARPEDQLNAEVFKSMAKYISPILRNIFNTALRTKNVPEI